MKNTWNILFVLFLLFETACNSPSQSIKNTDLVAEDSICFPIDEHTYYASKSIFQFEENGHEYLSFLDAEYSQKINIYDIKNQKLIKIVDKTLNELQKLEIEKLVFLENNSKALPRKQLNKDKGVGAAGVFLFSLYYELQDEQIVFYRKKEDINIQEKDFEKKLISATQGIKYQLDSGLTYLQNKSSKKIMDIILQRAESF